MPSDSVICRKPSRDDVFFPSPVVSFCSVSKFQFLAFSCNGFQTSEERDLHLAWLHDDLNNTAQCETFAVEALAAAKEANNELGEGNALVYLGRIYMRTYRVADARQTLEQALATSKQLNDPASQLNTASNLVEVYIQ
jgi:hypothetical protein